MALSHYYTPTEIVFGKDAQHEVGSLVKKRNFKKVLVHYGGASAKRSGLLDDVYASLDKAGVHYVSLGGVVPNPVLSKVYEGIGLCKKEGVDFILAVGGGSVIDSSKAIAFGVTNDFDVWDLFAGKTEATACLPTGAILTIAAAGSEMSDSTVITKEEGLLKWSYASDLCRCRFSILNPELTYTLPQYQTRSGIVDIMMHTMERYFTRGGTLELTDQIGEALIRDCIANGKILEGEPENYKARAEIMWSGSLSHNGLTGFGSAHGDWATHGMEMELSGMFDVAHGAGLAALWGSWARYVYKGDAARFVKFAERIFGITDGDPDAAATKGIEAMEAFFRSISMPVTISELGVDLTDAQIDELSRKCSRDDERVLGAFKSLRREDIAKIYQMAK
jgi:alcohol dehydrogenase YqhD (iron-dependent ADH family)